MHLHIAQRVRAAWLGLIFAAGVVSGATAADIRVIEGRPIATQGVEKVNLEGVDKQKWERALVSVLKRDSWSIGTSTQSEHRLAYSSSPSGRKRKVRLVDPRPDRGLVAAVNQVLVGPQPEVEKALANAERAISDMNHRIPGLEQALRNAYGRIDALQKKPFWWIVHIAELTGLDSAVEGWSNEIKFLRLNIDLQHKLASVYRRQLRPYLLGLAGDLVLKINKRGTKMRLRGTLELVAHDSVADETRRGTYQIDHRGRIER